MKTSDKDKYDAVLYWENIATTRRYAKHTSEIEKRVILEANNLAPKQSKVLEIGCEGGRWSKLLADTGCQIICTDTNQDALNVCKSRIPAATCILASPTGILLPCDTESIGMTLCIEVPQVIQAHWFIDEAFRVLHVGGLLVGVFFNRSSWRGLAHYALAPLRGGSIYTYCLSYPQWRRKLSKRGFSLLYEEGFGWSPLSKTSNSPLVPIATRLEHYLAIGKIVRFSPMIIFIAQKTHI